MFASYTSRRTYISSLIAITSILFPLFGGWFIIPQARYTEIIITYNGSDISKDLRPYLLSFTFTDNAKGKADDISLTLQDSQGEWLRDWVPAKSDSITASIVIHSEQGAQSLPCGDFSVDQIDYAFPPHTLTIKAVSADIKRKAVTQRKTKQWEDTTLSGICGDIASNNGLSLLLDIEQDFPITRVDQTEQSDLDFLFTLCNDYGWSVKLQKGRLVVYNTEKYENASESLTLTSDDRRVISARFSSKTAKVYKKARVKYHDPVKDEDYEEEYEDDAQEGSERELEIIERAESKSDAQRIARERVTEANRKEITGSITMLGDVRLAAGITVMLDSFGMFSGKYFLNKVTHKIDPAGYTTTLELGLPKQEKGKSKSRKGTRKSTGGTSGEVFYEGERYYK